MKSQTAASSKNELEPSLRSLSFSRLLARAIRRSKGLYLGVTATWTVVYGLPLAIGLVLSRLFDRAGSGRNDCEMWWLFAIAGGLMICRAVTLWSGLRLTFALIFKTSAWLKMVVLRDLLGRPMNRDTAVSSGETINRLRDDTEEIGGLLEWTTDLGYRSVLVAVAIMVLVITDWIMTIPLLLLLGGLFASVFLKNRVADLQTQIRIEQGRIGSTISDTLTGIRDLRLAGAMNEKLDRLEHACGQRRQLQQRHQFYAGLLSDMFRNLVMIGIAAVLVTASWRIVSSDFTIGTLVLFITYSGWLSQHMSFFGKIFARYQSGKVSFRRLAEIHSDSASIPGNEIPLEPLRVLSAKGMTRAASHGGSSPKPVDFTVRHGELTVITGSIGAGKSTVVRALLALQVNGTGDVRWNDTVVSGNQKMLSTPHIGYARQSPRFVAGTVRSNLRLGDQFITEKTMGRALTAVHLSPGSPDLPEGLDTVINSAVASTLSGGQRQRLALARMLCRPAEIYVVDDCDSSLDGRTARCIWQNMIRDWPCAWIVVSHNADLLARADAVVRVTRQTYPLRNNTSTESD